VSINYIKYKKIKKNNRNYVYKNQKH
jgi:hypothetical protein